MCACVSLQLVGYYRQGNRLPPSPLCPPEVADIIKKCWEYQAADRPSFSDLSTEIICAMLNIGIWYFCTTYVCVLFYSRSCSVLFVKYYQCLIPVLRVEPIPNLHAHWWSGGVRTNMRLVGRRRFSFLVKLLVVAVLFLFGLTYLLGSRKLQEEEWNVEVSYQPCLSRSGHGLWFYKYGTFYSN